MIFANSPSSALNIIVFPFLLAALHLLFALSAERLGLHAYRDLHLQPKSKPKSNPKSNDKPRAGSISNNTRQIIQASKPCTHQLEPSSSSSSPSSSPHPSLSPPQQQQQQRGTNDTPKLKAAPAEHSTNFHNLNHF